MVVKKKSKKKVVAKKAVAKPLAKKEETKKIKPLGVKVISTYYIIVSVLSFIFGIIVTMFPEKISQYTMASMGTNPEAAMFTPTVVLIVGCVLVVTSIIGFVLGLGLWNMKKWARMLLIIFATFAFFMAFMGLLSGELSNIAGLLINGFIAGYLIFSKEVKAVFK